MTPVQAAKKINVVMLLALSDVGPGTMQASSNMRVINHNSRNP